MRLAIVDWLNLYYADETEDGEDPCQRLPVSVVDKLTRTVFGEYAPRITGTGQNAEWLKGILAGADKIKGKAVQDALSGGETFLKPILVPDKKSFDFISVRRDRFAVLGRTADGAITDTVTAETTDANHKTYTLLERRTLLKGGYLKIENRLYQSADRRSLGGRVPLTALDKYAALPDEMTLPEPMDNLGMVCLRTPCSNCVDGSADGVAVYAAAAALMHRINRNEYQMSLEFDNGESRIVASEDMFRRDKYGRTRLTDHVFTALDGDPAEVGIVAFSPALRDTSFINRKQEYLRNIESLIGLKRGILSQVEAVERTAKEITSSEGDYNLTIIDFQRMWEAALRELLSTCEALGRMYHYCADAKTDLDKDFSIDWGDGVLYNRDKVWTEMVQMVQSGILKPEIAVAWYYDIPWETPKDLEKIKEKYIPEMVGLLGGV